MTIRDDLCKHCGYDINHSGPFCHQDGTLKTRIYYIHGHGGKVCPHYQPISDSDMSRYELEEAVRKEHEAFERDFKVYCETHGATNIMNPKYITIDKKGKRRPLYVKSNGRYFARIFLQTFLLAAIMLLVTMLPLIVAFRLVKTESAQDFSSIPLCVAVLGGEVGLGVLFRKMFLKSNQKNLMGCTKKSCKAFFVLFTIVFSVVALLVPIYGIPGGKAIDSRERIAIIIFSFVTVLVSQIVFATSTYSNLSFVYCCYRVGQDRPVEENDKPFLPSDFKKEDGGICPFCGRLSYFKK